MVDFHDVLNIIKSRRSIRNFSAQDTVNDELIESLVEAVQWAPSPLNRQPWKLIIVRDVNVIHSIAHIVEQECSVPSKLHEDDGKIYQGYVSNFLFFRHASCVIFVTAKKLLGFTSSFHKNAERETRDSLLLSVGAAVQNLLLLTHTLGLGSCWMTGPLIAKAQIEDILDINEPWELFSVIPIGKAVANQKGSRKNITTFWEEYQSAK